MFPYPQATLARALAYAETAERPQVLLLRRPAPEREAAAMTFFSSGWSKSYAALANPFGRTHRDFHYQVFFVALQTLAAAGCTRIRVDSPMRDRTWRWDAYVCLLEAVKNVRAHVGKVDVFLGEGTYDPRLPKAIEARVAEYHLQPHRPVGIHPGVFEGLPMTTVFVETATVALAMDRAHGPAAGLH